MKIIIFLITMSISLCAFALSNDDAGTSGDVLQLAMPAAAWGLTFANGDKDGRIEFYKAFAANIGATYALKASIKEERPDHSGDDSFPSSHTTMAFQSAAFLQMRYGWEYGAPAYALAAYTGWTRLAVDEHHLHDVTYGAAIGTLSSYLFTKKFDGAVVTPYSDGKVFGISVSKSW